MRPPGKPKILISFAYYYKTDIDRLVGGFNEPPFCLADSGAFSAMTVGKPIGVENYARWLKRWKHNFDGYFNLDVIRDHKQSERNLQRLKAHGLDPIPVFHTGSPWEVLDDLCSRYPLIGLGGMAGKHMSIDTLKNWLVHCFRIAREHGTKFHGLGMTTVKLNAALPFYSIDSTSWVAGVRFGSLFLWDGHGKLVQTWIGGKSNEKGKKTLGRGARLIREMGFDPNVCLPDNYDWTVACNMGAVAYIQYGEWLRKRHGPVGVEGLDDGLNLCIVGGSAQVLGHAFDIGGSKEAVKAWSKTLNHEEAYL